MQVWANNANNDKRRIRLAFLTNIWNSANLNVKEFQIPFLLV